MHVPTGWLGLHHPHRRLEEAAECSLAGQAEPEDAAAVRVWRAPVCPSAHLQPDHVRVGESS